MFIKQSGFSVALRRFLFHQRHPNTLNTPTNLPEFSSRIRVFHSAIATFYAPSNMCGAGGMYRERIRANRGWKGKSRYDTVFVKVFEDDDHDTSSQIMCGMLVARVLLFFSFHDPLMDWEIPCALVNWFMPVSEQRDDVMGMWEFRLEMVGARPTLEVIHLDSIVRAAHLLPHYGRGFLPENFDAADSLDAFRSYFVNDIIDYHAHELLQDS